MRSAFKMKGFGGFGNSPLTQKKKRKPQQGPQQEANMGPQKNEEGTWIYKGDKMFDRKAKAYKFPTTQNIAERITDYEDRAEFSEADGNKKQQKMFEREADIIRDRKPVKKKKKK